jgi:hypothetical protein
MYDHCPRPAVECGHRTAYTLPRVAFPPCHEVFSAFSIPNMSSPKARP